MTDPEHKPGTVRVVQWWPLHLETPEGAKEVGEPRDTHHHSYCRLIEWAEA